MNKVDYLQQHGTESLSSEEKLQMKLLGVHQLQDVVIKQTNVFPADVQRLLVIKEEVPDEWSSSLDHQDPEPPHIKEEEEELWTSQEETDTRRFLFTGVPVKSEDEEEKPQSSQLDQMKTESDGEDFEGPEPARNQDPNTCLIIDGKDSDSSKTEDSDDYDDDWQEAVPDSRPETKDIDHGWKESRTPYSCLVNKNNFRLNQTVDSQITIHTGEKPFGCHVCGKRLKHQCNLKTHMRVHTGEKSFGCNVCGQRFTHQQNLKTHMRIHTGEKPFVCDICGKRASHSNNLKTHMIVHTGEKPFSCDVCGKRFKRKAHLTTHMTVHTEEKPFGCDVCGKRFNRKTHLRRHTTVHTGEKPHSCDVCGQKFTRKTHLETHVTVHTGEKPFCCGVCGQGFTQQGSLNRHMRFHTG